jgi:hypothetical protein
MWSEHLGRVEQVADLEVENRMMRARNTRLEAELAAALRTIVELTPPKENPHE